MPRIDSHLSYSLIIRDEPRDGEFVKRGYYVERRDNPGNVIGYVENVGDHWRWGNVHCHCSGASGVRAGAALQLDWHMR